MEKPEIQEENIDPVEEVKKPKVMPILFFEKQFHCKELDRWIGRGHYRPADEKELGVLRKYAASLK